MNTNELDKVIPVNNPLEPEKGGYYKAFMESRDFNPNRKFREFNEQTTELGSPFFDAGCNSIPKFNLSTGSFVDISSKEISSAISPNFDYAHDFRVIDKSLGDFLGLKTDVYNPYIANSLVSLDSFEHNELIDVLDKAGRAGATKLSFDDAKYEPVFNKLEQYFQHFNISLKFQSLGYDFDGPNSNHNNINCDKAEITGNGLGLVSNRFEAFNSGYSNTNENWVAKISLPRTFRSENHFLKAGADVIASNLFKNFDPSFSSSQYVNNNINFDESERKFLVTESIHDKYTPHKEFIKSMTGIMFAAQLGAPVTQNDINRFNSLNIPNQDFKMLFDISTKANNYLKDIFLNKELSPADSAPSLWQQWKKDLISHAMQMATPSIPQICKQYNVEVTRDNVIRALNDLTNQKVNEVAQSKEPIKAALSQDQPINQAMLTKSISVPADKSKEPQSKGAER